MCLVFSISNFFINKIALADIWLSFSCSNLALTLFIKTYNRMLEKKVVIKQFIKSAKVVREKNPTSLLLKSIASGRASTDKLWPIHYSYAKVSAVKILIN